jgi:hypothetical protein
MHTIRRRNIMLEVSENDKMEDEELSLYQLNKAMRRRDTPTIRHVRDSDVNVIERPQDIPKIYLLHMREKFRPIEIDNDSVDRPQSFIQQQDPMEGECLNRPITLDEVSEAIRAGARHKAPGIDGISLDFSIANWETVKMDTLDLLNQMFLHGKINPRQKHGILICLPRPIVMTRPTDIVPYLF